MTMVHHLGQSNQDSENLSKAKQPGANLIRSHLGHSNNESCLIKHLLGHDKTLLTGVTPYILRAWT